MHRAVLIVAIAAAIGSNGAAAGPELSGSEAAAALQSAFVDTIERAEASVVSIARIKNPNAQLVRDPAALQPVPGGLLRNPFIDPTWVNTDPSNPDFVPNDYGSGVIIDSGGLVLTNYHVVAEADQIFVRLRDRRGLYATIRAADPRSDLAVLALSDREGKPVTGLRPITLGDAAALKKGQIVLALGNPYAVARDGSPSASWGIISNLARRASPPTDNSERQKLHFHDILIQTDTRLNLGTSGGPLLNLKGQMIGLTTALAAISGYEQSAGYAIPIDTMTLRIIDTLKAGREVEYGFLGIRPMNLTAPDAAALGLTQPRGARVDEVFPGTPAFRSGLMVQDLIVEVNGHRVKDMDDLVLHVSTLAVKSEAQLKVLRRGEEVTIPVVLSKAPVRGKVVATARRPAWRGLRVDYLTTGADMLLRTELHQFLVQGAVVVTEVEPGSLAYDAKPAGLRQGQLITRVGGKPVDDPDAFYKAVEKLSGSVELATDHGTVTVPTK